MLTLSKPELSITRTALQVLVQIVNSEVMELPVNKSEESLVLECVHGLINKINAEIGEL